MTDFSTCFQIRARVLTRISLFRFGAWMSFVVDLGKVLEVERGVDLGGGDAGMAEHLLDATKVGAIFEEVRVEGVS